MLSIFRITDGIAPPINLLSGETGFSIEDWNPSTPEPKDGGIYQDSPFSDGRIPVWERDENTIETLTLILEASSADIGIYHLQELRRLLKKAREYWADPLQNEPVWIEARGECETNTRYAILIGGMLPQDDNPYAQPFAPLANGKVAMEGLTLILEHAPWSDQLPGVDECKGTSQTMTYVPIWYYSMPLLAAFPPTPPSTGGRIIVPAAAAINNLPSAGDFTAEAWVYIGETREMRIFDKTNSSNNGWYFGIDSSGRLEARIYYNVVVAYTRTNAAISQNTWHHVTMEWDLATLTIVLWLDGATPAVTTTAGVGVYNPDATFDLYIGNRTDLTKWFWLYLGWNRISTTNIYGAPFAPPARSRLPAAATATNVGIWCWSKLHNSNGTVLDYTANSLDGAASYLYFRCYPVSTIQVSVAKTCNLGQMFTVNCHKNSRPTHVWHWDQSLNLWSANVLDAAAFPAPITVNPVAVNDRTYFAWETAQPEGPGPIWLDVDAVGGGNVGTTWLYSTAVGENTFGPAASGYGIRGLPNTHYLSVDGRTIIGFDIPPDWAARAVNGINAFYIVGVNSGTGGRVDLNGIVDSLGVTHPAIFAPNASWFDVTGADVQGDLEAAATHEIIHRFEYYAQHAARHHLGLRMKGRSPGVQLIPFLGGDQVSNSLVTWPTAGGPIGDHTAPNGFAYQFILASGASGAVTFYIYSPLTEAYNGLFRLFIRAYITTGGAVEGDVSTWYQVTQPIGETSLRASLPISQHAVTDLGMIGLGTPGSPYALKQIVFTVDFYNNASGNRSIRFYDICLLPADEWNMQAEEGIDFSSALHQNLYMTGRIGGIQRPKQPRLAVAYAEDSALAHDFSNPFMEYSVGMAAQPFLRPREDQQIFFLNLYKSASVWRAHPTSLLLNYQIEQAQRYLSMRGAR